uniref:Uncharacterized protein n=1 Tax=viral metagenome TaxID=1070528 RepID=A0A6C0IK92_9ZZZZ
MDSEFQINAQNSELIIKPDRSVIYRYHLEDNIGPEPIYLSVNRFRNSAGPADIKCCVNMALYCNNTMSSDSIVVFGFPNPIKLNQTEEELLANCPCIPYMYSNNYDYVLDILFFRDNARTGINIGEDWSLQVKLSKPTDCTEEAPVPLWIDDYHT